MKKILFLFITGLTVSASYSQEVSDALRYSQENLTGTARYRAMSGAFGAVGGDISALSVNPAGSAIFNSNQVGVTFSNQNVKNNSNYFGTQTSDKENSFILNQAGGVFVFKDNNPNNGWNKIAIGATYENTNNFDNQVFSAGTNPTNSVDGYFLDYANGIRLQDIDGLDYRDLNYREQQAYMGYWGHVIDPAALDPNNTEYISNVPAGGNYYQENEVYTRGYNSKLGFNIATSYKDKLYFGANLNVHVTDYRRTTSFYEDNDNPLQPYETISNLRFNNELYTYGNGFSFQLGAIGKVTDNFRLGVAYESNTWYELYDETSQSIYTTRQADGGPALNANVNPNVINVYESYTLQTPDKWTFSAAYVFGKSGLLSIDYGIRNYGNSKFKPTNDAGFREINSDISNTLTSTGELRIGGEYKIKQLSLRGGYRYEGSPYKNGITVGELNSYSAGLGYSFGATKLDLAYSYLERKSNQGFFSRGFTDGAEIKSKLNNVTMTLLFEL
ncbi:OmpP1/FadL family transporter [Flavobacterium sp. DG2-3]|uniref:OmpP1/FadL family transporter n=1 Tax=Flavobacterium sp. DG2-3 TaxID=3068317 RepID=UPI00273E0808|nr:outer membrane protein transport protein [Flavobacterium sp. DG2-3]MDP5199567.1 outer membrane protein transport protein [Flavobacterium sp. DG2-3]